MTRTMIAAGLVTAVLACGTNAGAQEVQRKHKTYAKKYYKPARERDEEHAAREYERQGQNQEHVRPSRRDKWARKLEEADSTRARNVQEEE